jgi:hypothetical protein
MSESTSVIEVCVAGTGSYVPEKILTNEELAARVDTSDEWIVTRTGIKERRIAADDEFTSHMASAAARKALEQAGTRRRGHRTDRRRHHHAGHADSGDRLPRPAAARRDPTPWLSISPPPARASSTR